MQVTGGARVIIPAAVAMFGGLCTLVYGIVKDDLARAIGGASLLGTAFLAVALVLIRRWIINTSDERRILAAAQRHASDERTRYIAAQAALENEHGRLQRDMLAERRQAAAALAAEREAMAAEFEEQRAILISETMEATVLMMRSGKLEGQAPAGGTLIHFPEKAPRQRSAQQPELSREHGVGGP